MLQLAKDTQLPASEQYPGVGSTLGISLAKLKSLRDEWVTTFDWTKEQSSMNKYVTHSDLWATLTNMTDPDNLGSRNIPSPSKVSRYISSTRNPGTPMPFH
jgi:hypothetical protein